jgi:diguanylate cyclase (GGDEF)-like protein
LSYAAAAEVFRVLGPAAGVHAAQWALLAAGCGAVRLAAGEVLALLALKCACPDSKVLRRGAVSREAVFGGVAELATGTVVAAAAAVSTVVVVCAVPLTLVMLRSLRHEQLMREATTDGKTGLLCDRVWRRRAAAEVARAARTGSPLAVALIDIDHFKQVNDTHGHLAGDCVLSAVAAAARDTVRPYDLVGRVGGEEFAVLLPRASLAQAAEVAQRMRQAIRCLCLEAAPPRVTVSIGLAVADRRPGWDLVTCLEHADQALYAAKNSGRDAVWVCPQADPRPRPAPPSCPAGLPVIPRPR